ncbi:hypothetical protein NK6_5644 [Bradyrhizobium diazoefficiens]|uniref:Uncharacterized protein n=1 Tax=Bradyrhizobium diazoefficiens TaxID=1355477 RepID=A0A0E4BRB3_9BRAD|nr:hypothetical protein NK6_5644 [Bradyrhizobium diazoefficiens]
MTNKQEFKFTVEEIEQQINALYDLDDMVTELQVAESEHSSATDAEKAERIQAEASRIRSYFECLADSLWKAGAFKSREEARSIVRADIAALQHVGGPGGVVPDDGSQEPDEVAKGLVALSTPNEFFFQAPLCRLVPQRTERLYTMPTGGLNFRLRSKYSDLLLVQAHPELREDKDASKYLWIEGCVRAHRYDLAKREIDLFLVSAMGIMEVLGLLRYSDFTPAGCSLSIGNRAQINSGQYSDMHSVRLSRHFLGLCDTSPENDIDAARTGQHRIESNLRIFFRAIADSSPSGLAVRHACRTYLRAYESWNLGEAAMFLAATMEGLLLDKRQKDDLSVRLQDSVAYWIGGPAAERGKIRKCVSELYKIRSNYVHNGEDAPTEFRIDVVRGLTRRVIRKELLTLGSPAN